jgi:hypothetical protein
MVGARGWRPLKSRQRQAWRIAPAVGWSRGPPRRRAALAVLVIAGSLGGVGCGKDDTSGSSDAQSASRTGSSVVSRPARIDPTTRTGERRAAGGALHQRRRVTGENRALDAGGLNGLVGFARRYLVDHVCPDASIAPKVVVRILGALRTNPRLTRAGAAESVCNETRR